MDWKYLRLKEQRKLTCVHHLINEAVAVLVIIITIFISFPLENGLVRCYHHFLQICKMGIL